jgi:hypothetical protein
MASPTTERPNYALWLPSTPPVGRVAEPGTVGLVTRMKVPASIFGVALALTLSGCASSLDLASLPDLPGANYKVTAYITAAARLQKMGREPACQTLLQAAQTNRESQQIIVLCRMLFTQRSTSEFRRPLIGGAHFFGDTDYPHWPLEPIELVDGVPFLITQGYVLGGVPESADAYLQYCMTNCDWSTARFREPTAKQKRDALAKLVTSSKWKRPLDTYERGFLSAQIE